MARPGAATQSSTTHTAFAAPPTAALTTVHNAAASPGMLRRAPDPLFQCTSALLVTCRPSSTQYSTAIGYPQRPRQCSKKTTTALGTQRALCLLLPALGPRQAPAPACPHSATPSVSSGLLQD